MIFTSFTKIGGIAKTAIPPKMMHLSTSYGYMCGA
jgi:hypothetical protein